MPRCASRSVPAAYDCIISCYLNTAYNMIFNIWHLARPEDGPSEDETMRRLVPVTHQMGCP